MKRVGDVFLMYCLLAVVAMAFIVLACSEVAQIPTTPGVAPVEVAEPTASAATPTEPKEGSAKVWAHGAVDVTGPWRGFVCYFWFGEHEQDPAHEPAEVNVKAGETVRYHMPHIKPEPPEHCELQIDVATSCAKSSIIPGLIADGRVKLSCPNPTPTPSPTPTPPVCVEEGPYVQETVWSGEVLKGPCPEEFSTSCKEKCHELGKQKTTWDCKPALTVDVCRPVDCPKPEGLCHVSNKGTDRNMNMVITQHGHRWHANRCPPDLPKSQCSCDNVIAAAMECNPGATNYDCKDVR